MKGVIVDCLKNLVVEKFGKDKWTEILEAAGFNKFKIFRPSEDVPDSDVLKLVQSTCKVLGITPTQAADAFGEYWMTSYAPKVYKIFLTPKTAKDFLLKMDSVHEMVTKRVSGAHPPRFDYEWKDDKTLIMTYKSQRNLIDFVVGLVKGVGKYYNEKLTVTKLGSNKVQVKFL